MIILRIISFLQEHEDKYEATAAKRSASHWDLHFSGGGDERIIASMDQLSADIFF
jgi:hypothetical protein